MKLLYALAAVLFVSAVYAADPDTTGGDGTWQEMEETVNGVKMNCKTSSKKMLTFHVVVKLCGDKAQEGGKLIATVKCTGATDQTLEFDMKKVVDDGQVCMDTTVGMDVPVIGKAILELCVTGVKYDDPTMTITNMCAGVKAKKADDGSGGLGNLVGNVVGGALPSMDLACTDLKLREGRKSNIFVRIWRAIVGFFRKICQAVGICAKDDVKKAARKAFIDRFGIRAWRLLRQELRQN